MPKPTRGLPNTFRLDVPAEVLRGPVQLGDYMDEQLPPTPVVRPPAPPQQSPVARTTDVHRAPPPARTEPYRAEAVTPTESEQPLPSLAAPAGHFKRVSRKQLNLNPETLRMVDELLHHIQTQSVQKDAKASEMFHALVAALYDSREFLSLADVPPRGRWGTPTAFAFPVALKNAFQSAIAQWAARYGR